MSSLLDEIAQGESNALEFKLFPNQEQSKYLKTVVAFANGRGGRILFGVSNDRTVQGIDKDRVHAMMDEIADAITRRCALRITLDLGIENVQGKYVIVLEIMAGRNCPYFLRDEGERDGVYIRVGATTQRADDATRRELFLLGTGQSCDGELCPAAKIDESRVQSLCESMEHLALTNCTNDIVRRGMKHLTPAQLEAWGVIARKGDRWIGSNTYALLTGDPAFATRLKCAVFRNDSRAVFVDRREFVGSVPELIDQGSAYLMAKINMGCSFHGSFRQDNYELPLDELRELVVNAFAHRNYLNHDEPVFLCVYDDRVEITSPGGLPRGQTVERAQGGYSKPRNPILSRCLSYMHFMEEWGSGLLRVKRALEEYGLPPLALEDAGQAVRANVCRAAVDAKPPTPLVCREEPTPEVEYRAEDPEEEPLDLPLGLQDVVRLLILNAYQGTDELADLLHVSRAVVQRRLRRLRDEFHAIERVGTARQGYWRILRKCRLRNFE